MGLSVESASPEVPSVGSDPLFGTGSDYINITDANGGGPGGGGYDSNYCDYGSGNYATGFRYDPGPCTASSSGLNAPPPAGGEYIPAVQFIASTPPAPAVLNAVGGLASDQLMTDLFANSQVSPPLDVVPAGATSGVAVSDPYWCDPGLAFSASNPAPGTDAQGTSSLSAEETEAASEQCYDIAMTSSPPPTSGVPGLAYYAYALDATSVLVGSAATAFLPPGTAPQLTLQQLVGIYSCAPGFTNWDTVKVGISPTGTPIYGANAPIYRFWPEAGSAAQVMMQEMLSSLATGDSGSGVFDPTTGAYNPGPQGSNSSCTNSIYGYGTGYISDGSSEAAVANANPAALAGAVEPYSVGSFVEQWDHPSTYNSAGGAGGLPNFDPSLSVADLGGLGQLAGNSSSYSYGAGTANPDYPFSPYVAWSYTLSATGNPFVTGGKNASGALNPTTVNEGYEWSHGYGTTSGLVPGVHYLYNVVDSALPSYAAAVGMVGFNNTGAAGNGVSATEVSSLCSDTAIGTSPETPAQVIAADGFVPLGAEGGPAGSNTIGTHCREFPVAASPGANAAAPEEAEAWSQCTATLCLDAPPEGPSLLDGSSGWGSVDNVPVTSTLVGKTLPLTVTVMEPDLGTPATVTLTYSSADFHLDAAASDGTVGHDPFDRRGVLSFSYPDGFADGGRPIAFSFTAVGADPNARVTATVQVGGPGDPEDSETFPIAINGPNTVNGAGGTGEAWSQCTATLCLDAPPKGRSAWTARAAGAGTTPLTPRSPRLQSGPPRSSR